MPAYIVLDTQNPEPLIEFWTKIQEVEVLLSYDDGRYTALGANREGLMVVLQRVPEAKTVKNRAHFDLVIDDLDASTARVLELGGDWLGEPDVTHELMGFTWRPMQDPEGNEFCLYLMAEGMNNDAPLPH